MSKLGMYLVRNTEYCAETRNLIEDTINAVNTQISMCYAKDEEAIKFVVAVRLNVLRNALQSMGFSDEQLTAFAKDELPTEYQMVPVDVGILRVYRTYVRVPLGAANAQVEEAVEKQILENGDACLTLDPVLDIEHDDIRWQEIDWDGAQLE